jgi:MFS family permease
LMAESAKRELDLSDSALSLIQGMSAAIPLVLFSIPIGILVDRANRIRLLLLCGLIWSAGTFLTAIGANAWVLFFARMLTGIGTTGALTAALSVSADLCQPAQRGKAMLIATLGKSLGQAASFAVPGALLGLFAAANAPVLFDNLPPWRTTQWVLGFGCLALVLPILFVREPARHEIEAGPKAPFRQILNELWARRRFLIPLFVGQTTIVMADAAAGIWVAPVLERDYGLHPSQFGGWLGAIMLGTGIVGAIIGGMAADRGQKGGRRGGILLGAIIAAIISIPAALFPIMPSVASFAVMIGLLVLTGTITGLITSVALTVLLPNELRGLSIGAFISIAGLIGFGIAPSLVTALSSLMGGEHMLAESLAIVGVAVSIVSVFAFWLAMRRAPSGIHDTAE